MKSLSSVVATLILSTLAFPSVGTAQTLQSITVYPQGPIVMLPTDVDSIQVVGNYSDGSSQDLTLSSYVQYTISNPGAVNLLATSPAGSGATVAVNPYAPDAGNDTPVILTASYNNGTIQLSNFTSIVRINGGGILGFPTFSTQNGGPFDFIDPATDVVNVSIPIRHKAGKIPFDYNLVSSTSDYVMNFNGNLYQWISSTSFRGASNMEVRLSYTAGTCPGHPAPEYFNFRVIDASGTAHPLVPAITLSPATSCSYYQKSAFTSNDDTGYYAYVDVTSETPVYTLMDRSGNSYSQPDSFGGMKMTDPNGVTMTKAVTTQPPYTNFTTTYTDSLGQVALIANTTSGGTTAWTYQYYDASGTAKQSYTLNFGSQTAATNFNCSFNGQGIIEMPPTAVYLPVSLSVPGGGSYSFAYEATYGKPSYTTERLSQLTLSTGGYTKYTYGGTANDGSKQGINCTDQITVPTVTRTVVDTTSVGGSGTGVWTYTNPAGIAAPPALSESVKVQRPDGNYENYTFSNAFKTSKTMCTNSSCTGTSPIVDIICYNGAGFSPTLCPVPSSAVNYPISELDAYESLDGSSNKASKTALESHGLPTEIDRYDFGPTLISKDRIKYGTETSYLNCSNTAMAAKEIFDRVCYDGLFKSDGATIVNYRDATYDAEGNKQSSRILTAGTSTFLTTNIANNGNGTVKTITEPNNAVTAFYYNGTDGCNLLMPTSTTLDNGLSTSQTWDCNGSVVKGQTDVSNSTAVSYDYTENNPDPLWRVKEFTDESSNDTTFTYSSVTSSESNLTFASSTQDTLTTLDSLGRKILVQKKQGPSASQYDTVRTTYDNSGRVSTVSVPFSCALNCTVVPTAVTTQTYDSAGRPWVTTDGDSGTITKTYIQNTVISTVGPTPIVTRQLQYDGLGRLGSVCEVSGQTGNGACGQHTSANGFVTSYLYREDGKLLTSVQGVQTRTFTYDNAGRMLTESNPENGIKSYFYDSDSTMCGNGPSTSLGMGNLVKTIDAAGNCAPYYYDSLHRLIAVGNTNAATRCKRFGYDNYAGVLGSRPTGVTVSNTMGRLVEVETDTCAWPITQASIITDKWLSYSPRGEVTDIYSSSQNSAGYYHLTKSYWPNGTLASLGGVPSIPTITYGVDGEGRWNTVSASSGVNPVTATSYNAASQVTGLTFGSASGAADTDSYQYDPGTGRETVFQFNVGTAGQNLQGTLTWNSNGTLKQLKTLDSFNSIMNNITVGYTYDDLGRVASAIGGTWSQNFSYDRYGNITKTGNSSWGCATCYNTSTNQYNSTLSNLITYDTNGNLTNDTFNTYQWDANGRPIVIDGVNSAYDAQGNLAEQDASWGTQEYLYDENRTQIGGAIGQGSGFAYIPLPGGAQALYSQGVLYYTHADWLNSARFHTTPSHTVYGDTAFAPYGESYASTNPTDPFHFAGYPLDFALGLFDTPNREYQTNQGRWVTPDPAGLDAVDPSNPQSWNRYAYVGDSPLNNIDPSGLLGMFCDTDTCPSFEVDGLQASASTAQALLRTGFGAFCPQCGNPWHPMWIGANNQVNIWEWLASSQPSDCSTTLCPARGYDWVLVGQPSYVPTISDLMFSQVTGPTMPTVSVSVYNPTISQRVNNWWYYFEQNHSSALDVSACAAAPGAVTENNIALAQAKGLAPRDTSDGAGGSGAVWMYNIQSQRNGGQSTIGSQSGAAMSNGYAAAADYLGAVGPCMSSSK
jgi:RHS repeat-associated protein